MTGNYKSSLILKELERARKQIRSIQEKQLLSLKDLEKLTGISAPTLSRFTRGIIIDYRNLKKLRIFFDKLGEKK